MAKKKRKAKPVQTKLEKDHKTKEVFCGSRRFIPSFEKGPAFQGFEQSYAWENRVKNYTPEEWKTIGNIKKCYHGTSVHNIAWIAIQSLLPGGRGNFRRQMLGRGIYVAPNPKKAWGFAAVDLREGKRYRYLLQGRVALGKAYSVSKTGDYSAEIRLQGYDSVSATRGALVGAWGGQLQKEEWVVYNPIQVVIDFVYEYEGLKITRPTPFLNFWDRKNTKSSIHPCQVEGKRCLNSYGDSGCLALKKKRGITLKDFESCYDFEVSVV